MRIYKKGKDSHLFNDLNGKKFGRLSPVEYITVRSKLGSETLKWRCICECGEKCFVRSAELASGKRTDCKKCSKKRHSLNQILPDKLSALRRVIRTYKKHADNRKRKFDLSEEEFKNIIEMNCDYCGEPPKSYLDGYSRNGIDRIDSSIGYTKSNVAPCCEMCNRAKLDHSKDKFIHWIKAVYNHIKRLDIDKNK